MSGTRKIGRYEIIEPIGRGSMGKVYLARDPEIDRNIAIKVIIIDESLSERERKEAIERFHREVKLAGGLLHPNIVTIFDYGNHDGTPYIAMEHLSSGRFLQDYATPGNLLPPARVTEILAQVCDALSYAHGKGIVHRDIKPSNIMLVNGEKPKVMDFGIAKTSGTSITQEKIIAGTPSFMSPEQIKNLELDGRSDLFSLGVVLYMMLTGQKPFKGDSISAMLYQILYENPPAPSSLVEDIPESLEKLVSRALAKSPDRRFQSAEEFKKALLPFSKDIPPASTLSGEKKDDTAPTLKNLADVSLASVLGNIFKLSASGTLAVEYGEKTLRLLIERGKIKGWSGNVDVTLHDPDRLTDLLVQLTELDNVKIGFGGVSPELPEREIEVSLPEVIYGLLAEKSSPKNIEKKLIGLKNHPVISTDITKIQSYLELDAKQGFALSRIDGQTSFEEIIIITENEEGVIYLLYWLILIGAVEFPGRSLPEVIYVDPLNYMCREKSTEDETLKRQEQMILSTYERIRNAGSREVLDVPENADIKQIAGAYEKLRRKFDGKNLPSELKRKLRHELGVIDMRLTEAHLDLTARALRDGTENGALAGEDLVNAEKWKVRMEVSKTSRQKEKEDKKRLAESYYKKALNSFNHEDYWRCIELCRSAVSLISDNADYFGLLARSLGKNQKWIRKAVDNYRKAIDLDPYEEDYYIELAEIYSELEMPAKAEDLLKRLLKINPSNKKARRLLKSL